MRGSFRIDCNRCGQEYGFSMPCGFGDTEGPRKVREKLETEGWAVKADADGAISEAICPTCLKKIAAEEAEADRGEWPTSI